MNKIFKVFTTTQDGNLAYHVGDIKENVDKNRENLALKYGYKNEDLVYMNQVHGNNVVIVDENNSEVSKDIVAKLQEELEKYYHVKAAVGNLSEEAYNIRIIHDGEYYAENESALDFEYDEVVRVYNKEGISIGELIIADTNFDYLTINLFRKLFLSPVFSILLIPNWTICLIVLY